MYSSVCMSGFPGGSDSRESACNVGDLVQSLSRKTPWRRAWQPTPVSLPGESHGRRSLVGYSPRGSQRVGHGWATSLHFTSPVFKVKILVSIYKVKMSVNCVTLCNPMVCSPRGYPVHGARILEWVSIPFSRGSARPWDPTQVSCIGGRFLIVWDPREAPSIKYWSELFLLLGTVLWIPSFFCVRVRRTSEYCSTRVLLLSKIGHWVNISEAGKAYWKEQKLHSEDG